MTSVRSEELVRKYHPTFNSQDGDVVLCSAEGTHYRIPSYVLRNTSGLFRTLLSRSQNNAEAHIEDPIAVDETDNVVERLLRLISGLETPKWESFDDLERVVDVAEKWDAPGPLSIIRSAITAPAFLAEPLRLYILTTRYGWNEEARLASAQTLTLSLYDEKHEHELKRLASSDLMALLGLHRRRRDEFKKLLDSNGMFNVGNAMQCFCTGCGEKVDNHEWRELKARMFYEMDQRPMGDTLAGLDMEEWPESVACWSARCRKEGCGRVNYDKLATLRDIKACITLLPASV